MRHAILVFALLVIAFAHGIAQQAATPSCGDPIDALDAWPAIPARYNSGSVENSCAGGGPYGWQYQCVELIRRFFSQAKGVNTSVRSWCCDGAHGKAFFTRAKEGLLNQGDFTFVTFPNGAATSPPAAEDMIGFDGGEFGHIALVKRVAPQSDGSLAVTLIEQNMPLSVSRTLRAELRADGTYLLTGRRNIQGWIRLTTDSAPSVFSIRGGPFSPSIGTAFVFNPYVNGQRISSLQISGPPGWNGGQAYQIPNVLFQPPGTARERAFWWQFITPVAGSYVGLANVAAQQVAGNFDFALMSQLSDPQIQSVSSNSGNVTVTWTAPSTARSFMVRIAAVPWPGFAIQDLVVPGTARTFTFTGLPLTPGVTYESSVFAFSHDLRTPDPLTTRFDVSGKVMFFVAR